MSPQSGFWQTAVHNLPKDGSQPHGLDPLGLHQDHQTTDNSSRPQGAFRGHRAESGNHTLPGAGPGTRPASRDEYARLASGSLIGPSTRRIREAVAVPADTASPVLSLDSLRGQSAPASRQYI